MTTDTAVGVTKLVVEDGIALEKIQYVVSNDGDASDGCMMSAVVQDMPTIRFNAKESVEMPFSKKPIALIGL